MGGSWRINGEEVLRELGSGMESMEHGFRIARRKGVREYLECGILKKHFLVYIGVRPVFRAPVCKEVQIYRRNKRHGKGE